MEPLAGSFSIAFNNGGPVSLVWGWFWVAVMTMSVVCTTSSILLTDVQLRKTHCPAGGPLGLRCHPCLGCAARSLMMPSGGSAACFEH